jgi:hypothetical protein
MRQFFTWGFWLSLVALLGLTYAAYHYTRDDTTVIEAIQPTLVERPIDIIELAYVAQADPGFAIVEGKATGNLQIRIDGFRYMNILPGTPGENRCGQLAELAKCAVAADLLGDAVLWFSIVPLGPRNVVSLPPITQTRDGLKVLLANGWVVHRADTVKRVCDDDTASLADFVRTQGEGSVTTFSLDTQTITAVTCARNLAVTPTT